MWELDWSSGDHRRGQVLWASGSSSYNFLGCVGAPFIFLTHPDPSCWPHVTIPAPSLFPLQSVWSKQHLIHDDHLPQLFGPHTWQGRHTFIYGRLSSSAWQRLSLALFISFQMNSPFPLPPSGNNHSDVAFVVSWNFPVLTHIFSQTVFCLRPSSHPR